MFKILLPFVFVAVVNCGFFDLTDIDDPLALLWSLPPRIHQQFSQCKIDSIRNGQCMDKAQCLFTGGTPSGQCGIMFTCCSYEQSCVKTSDQKQSYFEITNLNAAVTNCKYTIKLRNKNVCQVRLDFEDLTLAPATTTKSSTDSGHDIFTCFNDELRITPYKYGVPILCGNNKNQHLYVHINQSTDTDKAVNIDINLASRLSQDNTNLPKPTWKIKFTQLECPLKKSKFDVFKYKDFDDITNDFNVLAPQGALQYFTETQGEIRSFGLSLTEPQQTSDRTSYPYSEHYTIAFRRPSNVCGIGFTVVKLNLFSSTTGCYHYLYIPELFQLPTNSLVGTSQLCTGAESDQFFSYPPGPLYLNFKAMDISKNPTGLNDANQGYQLSYKLLTDCPNIV